MARGIVIGISGREDYDAALMTYHPGGGNTSATWFHDDRWLDFNMQQTGHGPPPRRNHGRRSRPTTAGRRSSRSSKASRCTRIIRLGSSAASRQNGFSSDNHVRQRAYWTLFAGAAGVAYGHHSVWQMYAPGRRPINGPLYFWEEAIHRPGAAQMQHVRTLMESRPMLTRVPDQSVVADALDGPERIQAIRGSDHLFVYTGAGIAFTMNIGKISGPRVRGVLVQPAQRHISRARRIRELGHARVQAAVPGPRQRLGAGARRCGARGSRARSAGPRSTVHPMTPPFNDRDRARVAPCSCAIAAALAGHDCGCGLRTLLESDYYPAPAVADDDGPSGGRQPDRRQFSPRGWAPSSGRRARQGRRSRFIPTTRITSSGAAGRPSSSRRPSTTAR